VVPSGGPDKETWSGLLRTEGGEILRGGLDGGDGEVDDLEGVFTGGEIVRGERHEGDLAQT